MELRGTKTGVFVGCSASETGGALTQDPEQVTGYVFIDNRILQCSGEFLNIILRVIYPTKSCVIRKITNLKLTYYVYKIAIVI